MYRKIQPIISAMVLSSLTVGAFAQQSMVKGRLINQATQEPANDVQITIPALKLLTVTNSQGEFNFSQVPVGKQSLVVGGYNIKSDTINVVVGIEVTDIGDIQITFRESAVSAQSVQLATISLDDDNLSTSDDGIGAQNVSGLLAASRDPFQNTAAFVFGTYRFQPRTYNRGAQDVWINGIPMNDVETGNASWNQWGGLNDVFRGRTNVYGLGASQEGFGDILGLSNFDATAANQRKQTRISYSISNRSYRNRLMLTHSSGMDKKGWAYSLSFSKRWANEGYIPGTFYDGYSYYAAVSKKINDKHALHLTTFGAPTQRGKVAPAVQEAYDLAGTNFYNPNWGYQNGVVRNAKVANSFQPVTILNHEFKINKTTTLRTAVGYQFGKFENSTLDWYNARDPRPDYYRNLPSYATLDGRPGDATTTKAQMESDPDKYMQIDWDRLYNVNYANYENMYNVNGQAGNTVYGRRSVYVVGNDVDDIKKYSFNSVLTKKINDHISINTGINFIHQYNESYRELIDLLGGDFFVNLNLFAVQQNVPNVSFNQYDLYNPNRLVKVGDKYNYDYITRFNKGQWWGQVTGNYNKFDFFAAASAGTYSFNREGLFKNGLFADNSYGMSKTYSFLTYAVKGGATYKLNGRNYLFVNGYYGTDAPTIENTFVSLRTRNQVVDNPGVEKISSVEGGYLMRAPKLNIRAVGYMTNRQNQSIIKRFYNDDPSYQSFVNYIMQNVNTRFTGTELAVEYKINSIWTVTAVAALSQAFYTNNPKVSIYRDNDTVTEMRNRQVYIQDYYVAAGPQSAYNLGVGYRSPKYWFANLNFNYFDRNYIDINPERRTVEAVDLIPSNSNLYHSILDQEKAKAAFTVDLFAGKSFLLSKLSKSLPRNTYLYLNVGVNNILNNTNIVTGGFEQLRYDFSNNNPNKFPTKYFYGLGRNYFINVSLKF